MESRRGLTLIELMFVITIVSMLTAVSISIMQGRADSAKWSEGKVYTGAIARALRAHIAEAGANFTPVPSLEQLGFESDDLNGTYFSGDESGTGDFSWVISSNSPMDFLVTTTAPAGVAAPSQITLDQTGAFTETP